VDLSLRIDANHANPETRTRRRHQALMSNPRRPALETRDSIDEGTRNLSLALEAVVEARLLGKSRRMNLDVTQFVVDGGRHHAADHSVRDRDRQDGPAHADRPRRADDGRTPRVAANVAPRDPPRGQRGDGTEKLQHHRLRRASIGRTFSIKDSEARRPAGRDWLSKRDTGLRPLPRRRSPSRPEPGFAGGG